MTQIEPASADDHATFAELFLELETGDPVPDRAQFEAGIAPTTLFARDERGRAVGYAFFQLFGTECFVRHLVTAPAARRTGVGRALLAEVAARALARGARGWRLNVKVTNQPALRLYESLGFQRAFETWVLRVAWRALGEGGGAGAARAPSRQEHAVIERAFELPAASVSDAGGKILGVVFDGPQVAAFGSFDPTFPGVYPLRATRVDAALSTLRFFAQRAEAKDDPARPWRATGVQVVVEDAEPVARALLALGAEEVFRIAQLRAALRSPDEQ